MNKERKYVKINWGNVLLPLVDSLSNETILSVTPKKKYNKSELVWHSCHITGNLRKHACMQLE